MLNQCDKYCQFKSCDWYLHCVHNTENIKAFLKHMFKSLQTPLYEQTVVCQVIINVSPYSL